jgi:hypothetical protein
MKKLPTYSDFRDGTPRELMKTYKLSPRQLEVAQRKVNPGYSQNDMRKAYDTFYRRNRKDA